MLKLFKPNNIPNILTVLRVFFIPLYLYFLFKDNYIYQFISLLIFILASITDYIDGIIARKYNYESSFGKFLDPLADKFLVLSAFVAFSFKPETLIPLWLVSLFFIREIGITLLRVFVITQGKEMKTSFHGKFKTTVQMITISVITFLIAFRNLLIEFKKINYFEKYFFIKYIPLFLIILSLIATYYSGFQYLYSNKSK
jgi:cardiolipin synthase